MKILLLIDVWGWAWDQKAREIRRCLPQYEIDIKLASELTQSDFRVYNSIHSFGHNIASKFNIKGITTAISSHNFEYKPTDVTKTTLPKFGGLTAVSPILYDLMKNKNANRHIYSCPNGVNHKLFYPTKKSYDKLVILWASQETKGGFTKPPLDIKGYQHVFLPLKERLSKEKNIEIISHTNSYVDAVHYLNMPKVYNQANLFISTSFREGTPNGIFQAASCGIATIATATGCSPSLIKNGLNGFLIPSYNNEAEAKETVELFYNKIIRLRDDMSMVNMMGLKNREIIEKDWTWEYRAKQWIPVFENHRLF